MFDQSFWLTTTTIIIIFIIIWSTWTRSTSFDCQPNHASYWIQRSTSIVEHFSLSKTRHLSDCLPSNNMFLLAFPFDSSSFSFVFSTSHFPVVSPLHFRFDGWCLVFLNSFLSKFISKKHRSCYDSCEMGKSVRSFLLLATHLPYKEYTFDQSKNWPHSPFTRFRSDFVFFFTFCFNLATFDYQLSCPPSFFCTLCIHFRPTSGRHSSVRQHNQIIIQLFCLIRSLSYDFFSFNYAFNKSLSLFCSTLSFPCPSLSLARSLARFGRIFQSKWVCRLISFSWFLDQKCQFFHFN